MIETKPDNDQFFHQILEEHIGILLKVARTYCPWEEDRPDLIQDMKIQIWRSIDKYNPEYKVSTWLYRIVLNVAISHHRKNAWRKSNTSTWEHNINPPMRSESAYKEERLQLLDQFIQALNDLDKALMILYLEDKSHREISEILGMSVSNVGTKISRIKETLKKQFSQSKEIK